MAQCLLSRRASPFTGGSLPSGKSAFNDDVDLPELLYFHTMVRVNESAMIFVGSQVASNDRVYMFIKETQTFTQLATMSIGRFAPQAGLVEDGFGKRKLVVTGGWNNNVYLSSTEELDLDTLEWNVGPDLPQALEYGASVHFENSFLVVSGYRNDGDSYYSDFIYEYDKDLNEWNTRSEKLTTGRDVPAAFLVPDIVANCTI